MPFCQAAASELRTEASAEVPKAAVPWMATKAGSKSESVPVKAHVKMGANGD